MGSDWSSEIIMGMLGIIASQISSVTMSTTNTPTFVSLASYTPGRKLIPASYFCNVKNNDSSGVATFFGSINDSNPSTSVGTGAYHATVEVEINGVNAPSTIYVAAQVSGEIKSSVVSYYHDPSGGGM